MPAIWCWWRCCSRSQLVSPVWGQCAGTIVARRTGRGADRLADGGAAPLRGLGQAVGNGVQLANAGWVERESLDRSMAESTQRFQLPTMSERLASYIRDQPPLDLIRDHTPVDTRVFTPEWPYWAASLATGRPNNRGVRRPWSPDLLHRPGILGRPQLP